MSDIDGTYIRRMWSKADADMSGNHITHELPSPPVSLFQRRSSCIFSGSLTRSEVIRVAGTLNMGITKTKLSHMFDRVDTNGDKALCFDEFKVWAMLICASAFDL